MIKSKKIVIITFVILCAIGCILALVYFTNKDKDMPAKSFNELWPENGEVIATIDGKEYRYDPIYLYRLTNCIFDEDYNKSTDDIIGSNLISCPTNLLYGINMAEAAVGLELYYQEGLKGGEDHIIKTSSYSDERKSEYDYIPMNRNSATLSVAHEKAKFYPGQSNEGFVQELEPFLKKFAYINQGGYYYFDHRDEYNTYIAERFERYNVKMLY